MREDDEAAREKETVTEKGEGEGEVGLRVRGGDW